jgi:dTDP-4-amino-4,6-dideoxygalactose transaminase
VRDEMIKILAQKDIGVNVHFIPLPMLTLFKNAGFDISAYPNAYYHYSREISLPIYPQLTDDQINYIIQNVVCAYKETISEYSYPVS